MGAYLENALTALPVLALHFLAANLVFVIGLGLYALMTPYRELALIRAGNTAASIAWAGAMLALAMPVATALRYSLSIWDIAVWGAIAIVLQLATFGVVNLILRGVSPAIEAGETAAAIKLAGAQISTGAITAAAIGGWGG